MAKPRGRPNAIEKRHVDELSLDYGSKPVMLPDIARVVYGSPKHYHKTAEMLRRVGVKPSGKAIYQWRDGGRQTRTYLVSDIREALG